MQMFYSLVNWSVYSILVFVLILFNIFAFYVDKQRKNYR